jgi:nitrogen fixation protein FixH
MNMMPNLLQSENKMEVSAEALSKNPKDKWIPWCFVIFFAVIAVLDGIFVYMAVSTQTGVVTEQAYEKGLAYNELLEQAKQRPEINQKASYKDGVLSWSLANKDESPISNAVVTAHIKRPVQDGYDFDITLSHKGNGLYEADITLPMKGLWQAGLNSEWDNQKYQTSLKFVSR